MRRMETFEIVTNTKIEENHVNLVDRTEKVEDSLNQHTERLDILEREITETELTDLDTEDVESEPRP